MTKQVQVNSRNFIAFAKKAGKDNIERAIKLVCRVSTKVYMLEKTLPDNVNPATAFEIKESRQEFLSSEAFVKDLKAARKAMLYLNSLCKKETGEKFIVSYIAEDDTSSMLALCDWFMTDLVVALEKY